MNLLQDAKLVAAPLGWLLLRGTVRVSPPCPGEDAGPCIFACLHRDILPALLFVRPRRPVLLVSDSPDGDILVRTLGGRDYGFVRGSSEGGGGRALVALRRLVDGGRAAGLAVDGPKGPYGEVRPGVLQLARLTSAPIVPLRAHAARAVVLGTWDRTVVPIPGSRVCIEVGPRLRVAREAGNEELGAAKAVLEAFFAAGGETP